MSIKTTLPVAIISSACILSAVATLRAGTTIDPVNKYAYGANIGWMDWSGDTANGAVIGEYVCSGYIYSANCGWINVGNGSPVNGIYYQNNSAGDFGVNQDGFGNLRGFAYGANVGWINFTDATATGPLAATDQPRVDLKTGVLSGYVYSANCGWISLSNAFAFVQTDTIAPGYDGNGDGIPDAWELLNFGTTNINVNADPDHDGASNKQEYQAGTDPNDFTSVLRITAITAPSPGTSVNLTWNSVSNRLYLVQETLNLVGAAWYDSGIPAITPDGSSTTRLVTNTNTAIRFYRVQAFRPLGP